VAVVQRITICKTVLQKDDDKRRLFGLPMPSLQDFKEYRGVRPMKKSNYLKFMCHLALVDRKATPAKTESAQGTEAGKNKPGQGGGKRGQGKGQPYPRGRGGRGGRGGFRPHDQRDFGRSPQNRGRW